MSKTREVVKYGAMSLRCCATGGVLSKGDSPGATQFSDEEIRAIIVEAHRLGRKVAAHAHGSGRHSASGFGPVLTHTSTAAT